MLHFRIFAISALLPFSRQIDRWQKPKLKETGQMDPVAAIAQHVDVVKSVLERVASTLQKPRWNGERGGATSKESDDIIADLQPIIDDLQHCVTEVSRKPVLVISSTSTLMEAGIALYNASRNAFKAMVKSSTSTDDNNDKDNHQRRQKSALTVRYWIVVARFWACKVMDLSLSYLKSGGPQDKNSTRNQPQYLDACIDVLRSLGRMGTLMLESAKLDFDRCQQYLRLSEESFSSCYAIWSQIGLSYLTKLKQDLELEEVLEDLWDFSMDRIRVLQLLAGGDDDRSPGGVDAVVEALSELQMLVPYMPAYKANLLKLVKETSDVFKQAGRHQEQVMLAEEALRVCDSLDTRMESDDEAVLQQFKQSLLVNALETFGAMQDYQRAETCYSLLPKSRDSEAVLVMAKIYIEAKLFDKALYYLRILFEQDSLSNSMHGARLYAQALSYSDSSLKIYHELERNYGDSKLEISLDLACSLAFSETADRRKRSIGELKRIASHVQDIER